MDNAIGLIKIFASNVEDFRTGNRTYYSYTSIVFMSIVSVLCGAKTWVAMEAICEEKIDLIKKYLKDDFKGIPSHDCFRRFFSLLSQQSLETAFRRTIQEVFPMPEGVVAIDGKTACSARDKDSGGSKLHIVSAYSTSLGLCLGQIPTAEKSNEIKAIPQLLDELTIKNCIVTIDAMGCQHEIATKIIEKKADYILQVKGNQKTLLKAIESGCEQQMGKRPNCYEFYTETAKRYNKEITKTCFMCNHVGWLLTGKEKWTGAKSFASITTDITDKITGEQTKEVRYFISSLDLNAELLARSVRDHWQIENNLHWQLDVTFNEDNIRLQKNAMANLSVMNKLCLPILKKHPKKGSLANKQLRAACSNNFLEKLINYLPECS